MRNKLYIANRFLLILLVLPLNIFAQCFTARFGQKPAGIQTISSCNGILQTFSSTCRNSEYTKLNVTSGNVYTFKSSRSSDFITISDKNGTVAYATGTGTVTWTATLTTVVRFYTHANSACGADNNKKKRQASCTTPNTVPVFSHIVVVIGENTSAGSVFGNNNAPYINSLAAAGAKFTNSFALTHPSQPNYLQLYSGSNQGITNDKFITTKFTTANLGRELIDATRTYATYSEDLPSVGYDGSTSGLYVRRHNPAANWMGMGTNQIPTTTNQPFTAFPANFNNLPSVSFVIPNLCNDGHDVCAPLNNSVLQYDSWIQANLDAYKQWCINNNSLLIVTYDEDDYSGTKNKIATVFYGAHVAPGSYSQTINHYNVLRTIEEGNALTTHAGSAASATPIDYCWTAAPNFTITSNNKQNISESISVFPNPANNKINIMLRDMPVTTIITWEITNIQGEQMKSGQVANLTKGSSIQVAVDNLKSGVYLIRINDGLHIRLNRFVIAR